ncbi:MAG TPA: PAS domain S-box protein [Gallionellaceae bacterium]|nr:PAS domain S-box protein [Gallionellaceae bacterium]
MIVGAAYVIFGQYKKIITEREIENLGAIADAKVAQIAAWREAHKRRAEYFLHGAMFSGYVEQWLREGARDNEHKQQILRTLDGIMQEQSYKSVTLLDREGRVRMSTAGDYVPDTEDKKLAVDAMQSQRVLFLDLHREHTDNKVAIDSVAPLRVVDKKNGNRIVGALLLKIDPDLFLYPMIQTWPTQSHTAETLLTRLEGNDVVFLNELRHRKDTALTLHVPADRAKLPTVMAIHGETSTVDGVDYRGIPVVSAMRRVPETPWFLVAKIDSAELFSPINTLQQWVAGLVIAFAAFGGGLVFLWFKGSRARYAHLKVQHDAALERELLLKHLQNLTRYANDMIIVANETGQIIEANESAQQALGYSREELLQKQVMELHDPLDNPAVPGKLDVQKRGWSLRIDGIFQRKDGSTFPVEISARVIEVQGTFYMQSIIRDITERKFAEDSLRLHSAILTNLAEGILLVDAGDGHIVFVNPQLERMFAYGQDELIGKHVSILTAHGEMSPAEVATKITSALAKSGVWSGEIRNIRKNGIAFWCSVSISTFEHHRFGKVWVAVHENITERKAAEELTKSSEAALAEFKYTLDQTLDCVFIFEHDTLRFTYINEGAKAQVGFSEEELLKMTPLDIRPAITEADFRSVIQPLLDGSMPSHKFETIHRHKDGHDIPVEINLQLVRKSGQAPRFVAMVRDITERKLVEAELLESKELAEQANHAKSEFLSRMSHELRTPLNSIIGFAQIMEVSGGDETIDNHRDNLKAIIRSGWHLLRIIEDLLSLSAIEAGKIELNIENVELRSCMKECLELMEPLATQKMIELSCTDEACEGVIVRADAFRLKQVLINLLANAVKFNRVGGNVTIRGRRAAGRIRILICDTGTGISEDDLSTLFEPFSHLSKRPFSIEGAGIGLSIAKQLIELMGGKIGVESIFYLGSKFWIDLPVADGAAAVSTPAVLKERSVTTDKNAVLLYVEDNPDHIQLVEKIISRMDNITLLTAHTPTLGLDMARARRPDIILLDICLPGMNGFEVLNLLQRNELTRNIPVMAISASANPAEIEKGLRAGFRRYLTKPISVIEFMAAVEELLRDNIERLSENR